MRRGLGRGRGKGYYNLVPLDSHIHSLSARGINTMSKQQKVFLKQKFKQVSKEQPQLKEVRKMLLKKGGVELVAQFEEDIDMIITRGVFRDGKNSVLCKKDPIQCHRNSALLWDSNKKRYTLMTGYALSDDGLWRQHSWVWDKDKQRIIETTEKRKTYYGFPMTDNEAQNFLEQETLSAKGVKTHLLSASDFNKKFGNDYAPNEIGYATTRIQNGTVNIYVKDSGDKKRNKKLLKHEREELKLFKDLVKKGVDPNIADEMAHNKNPVKLAGVSEYYPLNPLNAKKIDDKMFLQLTEQQERNFFKLPISQAVIVPSTTSGDVPMSGTEFRERVKNVQDTLSRWFGGHTSVRAFGGYMSDSGKLIEEPVVKVVSYSTTPDYEEHRQHLYDQLQKWKRDWKQESVSYEFEDDLYLVS